MHHAKFGNIFSAQQYMVTNNNRGQTILLQVHRGKRSRYLRYTWQVSGLIITYRPQPTSLLSERGENVNFETQDCEHFPLEAGISQHFLRKCILLQPIPDLMDYTINREC